MALLVVVVVVVVVTVVTVGTVVTVVISNCNPNCDGRTRNSEGKI